MAAKSYPGTANTFYLPDQFFNQPNISGSIFGQFLRLNCLLTTLTILVMINSRKNNYMKKLLPRTLNNPQGFTLVELMVAIAIVAILAVVGITIFSGLQKNARDSKRRQDIDAIVKALETKYDQNTGYYPGVIGTWFAGGQIPTQPQGGNYTGVVTTGSFQSFNVCASLESTTVSYCRANQQ